MNSYDSFKARVLEHLVEYKKQHISNDDGEYGYSGRTYGHILTKEHFKMNFLPDVAIPEDIKFHTYSLHMNSSQVMGINFFMPLISEKELLFDILSKALKVKVPKSDEIIIRKFEYMPHGRRRTNFDFYLELSSGLKFYFEIKYTENGFGRTGDEKKYPERYKREWDKFYKEQCAGSLNLSKISPGDFFMDYQINRNVAYVKSENEHVVFIYPYDNLSLHKSFSKIKYVNVYGTNWHDIVNTALTSVENIRLNGHFETFREKYLDY